MRLEKLERFFNEIFDDVSEMKQLLKEANALLNCTCYITADGENITVYSELETAKAWRDKAKKHWGDV